MKKYRFIIYTFFALFFISLPFLFKNSVLVSDTNQGDNVPFMLGNGMIIKKNITIKNGNPDSFYIKFGTYGKNNLSGNMQMQIYDLDGNKIMSKSINFNKIVDNSLFKLDFDGVKLKNNKEYVINLYMENIVPGNDIALWGHYTEDFVISIDDEKKQFDFNLYYDYEKPSYMSLIYLPIYILLVLLIELFDENKGEEDVKKNKKTKKKSKNINNI